MALGDRVPAGDHVARLCGKSNLGSRSEVIESCFGPRVDPASGRVEDYLSVHWLEFLQRGAAIPRLVEGLREYLLHRSRVPGERKPTKQGRIAVLAVSLVEDREALGSLAGKVGFSCLHQPRPPREEEDPHSGIHSLPPEGPLELAVRQFLVSCVVYDEAGRP